MAVVFCRVTVVLAKRLDLLSKFVFNDAKASFYEANLVNKYFNVFLNRIKNMFYTDF